MSFEQLLIVGSSEFSSWMTINDTIMGGSSQASCKSIANGLCLEGNVVEKNGGFVSCCSPILKPSLDLSCFEGINIDIEGQGKTLKVAISCSDNLTRFTEYFSGGVRWIANVKTMQTGITRVKIPFDTLEPNIRANPIRFPLSFSPSSINQFQLLYSKFGVSGNLNSDFEEGPFRLTIHSLSAYS